MSLDSTARALTKLNDSFNQLENIIINAEPTLSDAEKVRQFTKGCGRECPVEPRVMTYNEVKFLIGMMLSEIVELAQTVTADADEAVELVRSLAVIDLKRNYVKPTDQLQLIADQADAAVDCAYYAYDAFAKTGVNLSYVFGLVHKANMDKRFPDGTFHTRDDGKIIKPPNWKAPDILAEILVQYQEGSFSD